MGRKRTTVAKKRVQKCATNKNIAFVVDIIPELKEVEPPAKKKAQVEIDLQLQTSGSDLQVNPVFEFVNKPESVTECAGSDKEVTEYIGSDKEDADVRKLPPIIRTYRRKASVEQLMQDWDNESSDEQEVNQANDQEINQVNTTPNQVTDCSCGTAEEARKYKKMVESLQMDLSEEILKTKRLAEENARLVTQNGKLQEALTSKLLPEPETPFKDCGEYIDANTLRQFSLEADSDYLFIKFIMMRLWPEGLLGRSVTGRQSNNPSGRPKSVRQEDKTGEGTSAGASISGESADGTSVTKLALEKEKVDYCIRCLHERRIFLRDDVKTAMARSKAGTSLMTRVIANASRS
ncbi:uncharacterized protein LOC135701103 [Ochlerotatus camptorhynchus]|uniref:uncharacterized protein LOC135701103 n=1 Tax=Ochlerotatus camptorhynchus TaxID=644619 RepID=UPI0031DE7E39